MDIVEAVGHVRMATGACDLLREGVAKRQIYVGCLVSLGYLFLLMASCRPQCKPDIRSERSECGVILGVIGSANSIRRKPRRELRDHRQPEQMEYKTFGRRNGRV